MIWEQLNYGYDLDPKNRWHIPVHTLIATIPDPLRKVLLAAYIGTGCDYLSRIGIEHGAIPEKFLHGFGLTPLSDDVRKLAEQYLVNVMKKILLKIHLTN